jgi:16S rRNA A1518/A1519 N6-dimethyltransferase RsmA/KsgA/DIM1 with predicted DNA glycosylase/AP lyase activity
LNYTNKKDTIIDVGAGVSVLIDSLLDKGYKNLSLLEFSPIAIQTVKNRLKNHLTRLSLRPTEFSVIFSLVNLIPVFSGFTHLI